MKSNESMVRLSKVTKKRLLTKAVYGDTYDMIVNRLIDYAELPSGRREKDCGDSL